VIEQLMVFALAVVVGLLAGLGMPRPPARREAPEPRL
jgi:hypothetical protein